MTPCLAQAQALALALCPLYVISWRAISPQRTADSISYCRLRRSSSFFVFASSRQTIQLHLSYPYLIVSLRLATTYRSFAIITIQPRNAGVIKWFIDFPLQTRSARAMVLRPVVCPATLLLGLRVGSNDVVRHPSYLLLSDCVRGFLLCDTDHCCCPPFRYQSTRCPRPKPKPRRPE